MGGGGIKRENTQHSENELELTDNPSAFLLYSEYSGMKKHLHSQWDDWRHCVQTEPKKKKKKQFLKKLM